MPGRIDRPGGPAGDQPGQGSPAEGQDALRRRLASLPASHPSSPWQRDRAARRERAARQDRSETGQDGSTEDYPARARPDRPAEPGESGPTGETGHRAAISGVSGRRQPAEGRRGAAPETTGRDAERAARAAAAARGMSGSGDAAAIVARAARGTPGRAEKEGRRREGDAGGKAAGNEALWRLAASQHAASQARRDHRTGTPIAPPAKRDAYRPWFADGGDSETWLSAEETGEPWFSQDDP